MKLYLIVLIFGFSVSIKAQEVISTNTDLVQTTVTVLDKKGYFVEGLQRDQFELMVDGKPRPVTFFERVASGSARERELAAIGNPTEAPPTTAAAPRVPGRTFIFFIDDLHLSPDSMN